MAGSAIRKQLEQLTSGPLAGVLAGVVATCTGILSWDASIGFAIHTLKVDTDLGWLFPAAGEGMIGVTTVAAIALRHERWRTRVYVWLLLAGAVALASVGNVKQSYDRGAGWWAIGMGLMAVAVAASLHVVVLVVRSRRPRPARTGASTRARGRARPRARRSEAGLRVVLDDGRQVSPAHARRLQPRRAPGAAP